MSFSFVPVGNRGESGNRLSFAPLLRVLAAALAVLALVAALPPVSSARHTDEIDVLIDPCQNCHTLNSNQGLSGTSHINTGARTHGDMMLEGWTTADKFACTFCHSFSPNDAVGRMVNALNDFGSHVSIHPVGKLLDSGTNNAHEYVSNYDGIYFGGGAITDELDCVDCHDVNLLRDVGSAIDPAKDYANHIPPGTGGRVGNPYMLRVSGGGTRNEFCLACHGSSPENWLQAKTPFTMSPMPHGETNIVEDDGTVLKTSTCGDCHDMHYSGKVTLFNDGKDGDTAIVSTDCTIVCHYPGDDANYVGEGFDENTFTRHGHGKAASTYQYQDGVVDYTAGSANVTLAFSCTRCHVNINTDTPGGKPHIENPSTADPKDDYVKRFNLDTVIQATDSESTFGNLVYGICFNCHAAYDNHTGGAGDTGCQDCHDEHGEGSGGTSNSFMIPLTSKANGNFDPNGDGFVIDKAGAEPVTYDTPRLDPATGASNDGTMDLYKGQADDTGFCDNGECHGGAAWWGGSLYDSMMAVPAPANAHSGGAQSADIDCSGCHTHNGDAGGGWRAQSSGCDSCHNFPPDGGKGFVNHLGGGAGNRSRDGGSNPNTSISTDVAFFGAHDQCELCHGVSDNGTADGFGTPVDKTANGGDAYDTSMHNDGNIHLNGISTVASGVDPSAPDDDGQNADYTRATGGCSRGCHSVPAEDWAFIGVGARPVQFLELGSGSCDACHGGTGWTGATANNYWPDGGARGDADGGTPNDRGAHEEHMRTLARKVYDLDLQGLVDNASSDAMQQQLCEYCHTSRAADLDHYSGDDAEVQDFNFYDSGLPAGSADDGGSDAKGTVIDAGTGAYAAGTCSGVDCHYEEVTPDWYSGDNTGNADCTHCHTGIPAGAGTHVSGSYTCQDCHPGGAGTNGEKHTDQSGGSATVVLVPLPDAGYTADPSNRGDGDMQAALGIRYTVHGGIHLGGENTSGSSEADICWNCHKDVGGSDNYGVSEWGYNTDTNGGSFPVISLPTLHDTAQDGSAGSYNYGWIYTSITGTGGGKTPDWTIGKWKDEYYHDNSPGNEYQLKRSIVSVHTANVAVGSTTYSACNDGSDRISSVDCNVASGAVDYSTPDLEPKGSIRCSFCHDVHDTFGGAATDSAPFLRGTWTGNPYPPDLPPRNGYPYPTTGGPSRSITSNTRYNNIGNRYWSDWSEATPRLFADPVSQTFGGYFIDANSGSPTAAETYTDFAGLCAICHGSTVDGMEYYDTVSMWRSPNGHNNSAKGGGGASAAANDMFTGRRSTTGPPEGSPSGGSYMARQNFFASSQIQPETNTGWTGNSTPGNDMPSQQPPVFVTGWYGGTPGDYVLPVTGVGDFTTWYRAPGSYPEAAGVDSQYHQFSCAKCHQPHASGLPALLITNCLDSGQSDFEVLAGPSATPAGSQGVGRRSHMSQTCHIKRDTGSGWHTLDVGQGEEGP